MLPKYTSWILFHLVDYTYRTDECGKTCIATHACMFTSTSDWQLNLLPDLPCLLIATWQLWISSIVLSATHEHSHSCLFSILTHTMTWLLILEVGGIIHLELTSEVGGIISLCHFIHLIMLTETTNCANSFHIYQLLIIPCCSFCKKSWYK